MIGLFRFVPAVLASPFKSKVRLEAENAVLRHQLVVLRRALHGRVRLTNHDRWFLVQMAAAMNGIAPHGGLIPHGDTFLCFSDYCRPAIRIAALMQIRKIFVMTHDLIGLGEDGPTHQPVERLAALEPSRTSRSVARAIQSRPPSAGN